MDDIKAFAVKLSAATDHFEERSSRVVETSHYAAQQLLHVAQQVSSTVERSTIQAMSNVKAATHAALADGLAGPVRDLDEALRRSACVLDATSQELAGRIEAMRRIHATHAWRAFIAYAIGCLLAVGASVYAVMQAREETARARWVSQINAAIDKGNLATCENGGVCARLGNKWVRLDK